MKSIKLWAIIDLQKKTNRFCYADSEKTSGAMAIYDKKPKIPANWKHCKKVILVNIELST